MAIALTALYSHPEDVAAFDAHYDGTHAPLAATMPGLTSYLVSRPGPGPDGAAPPYHLVAVLVFADEAALGEAMGSDAGRAAVADLENFAQAGVVLMTGPVQDVA